MTDNAQHDTQVILFVAAEIVSAFVSNNSLRPAELPAVIGQVHTALMGLATAEPAAAHLKATSAQIRKSITPDALISFVDDKPYKTLKRHLGNNGLDPHTYRERYGLPADYPIVAPSYSKHRSEVARALGLGRGMPRAAVAEPAPQVAAASSKRRKMVAEAAK